MAPVRGGLGWGGKEAVPVPGGGMRQNQWGEASHLPALDKLHPVTLHPPLSFEAAPGPWFRMVYTRRKSP